MKKFPVISTNGNEYLVKFDWLDGCHVYKKRTSFLKYILPFKKVYCVKHDLFNNYNLEDFDYDYIRFAMLQIQHYEDQIFDKYVKEIASKRKEIQKLERKQKFKEWDGIIK